MRSARDRCCGSTPRWSKGLFAPEEITAREPGADEQALAAAAYAAIPFERRSMRGIDMIRDDRGAPVILELEMTEPSMFFASCAGQRRPAGPRCWSRR